MQNKVSIKAPAKLNLFLRILGQKNNGYHIIRTGITFLDLFDENDNFNKNDKQLKKTNFFIDFPV